MMTPREKIKPILDVPMILQMEDVVGRESQSQFAAGVEYRYNVICEARPSYIYLPPEGRDAIVRARPVIGDFVELLKQKAGNRIIFTAIVLDAGGEPPAAPAPEPYIARTNGIYGRIEPEMPRAMQQRAAQRNAIRTLAPPPQNGHVNGHPAPPQDAAPAQVFPILEVMKKALHLAYAAWMELRATSKEAGYPMDFSPEDVRATANTLFIDRQKGAR